jgi:hypothetical protein
VLPRKGSGIEKGEYIRVLPNPATDIITVDLPEAAGYSDISILSATGRVILSNCDIHNNQIDISRLPEGIYIITATVGATTLSSKFIKQ